MSAHEIMKSLHTLKLNKMVNLIYNKTIFLPTSQKSNQFTNKMDILADSSNSNFKPEFLNNSS